MALDSEISEAYVSLCDVSVNRARWVDSEKFCRKAPALNPMDPAIYLVYGSVLLPATGKRHAALRASQEAYRLAPAAGALWHHCYLRNGVLGRMWPKKNGQWS